MHVADEDAGARFFVNMLGPKAWVHREDYAYVQRVCAGCKV